MSTADRKYPVRIEFKDFDRVLDLRFSETSIGHNLHIEVSRPEIRAGNGWVTTCVLERADAVALAEWIRDQWGILYTHPAADKTHLPGDLPARVRDALRAGCDLAQSVLGEAYDAKMGQRSIVGPSPALVQDALKVLRVDDDE